MALFYRNGKPYCYRSVRRGGKVVREYQASGEFAVLLAKVAATTRAQRDMEREMNRAEVQDRIDAFDYCEQTVKIAITAVEAIAASALAVAGYHRHDRGRYRKRRQAPDGCP